MKNFGSVLITGGTGFFGHGCVRALLDGKLSDRVCIYSRDEYKQSLMRAEFKDDPRLRFFVGDVRDKDRLTQAMQGVDVVIHAAALKRVEVGELNPAEMVKTNVLGSMNVIDAAHQAKVAKVVMLSTDKACEPTNTYGASKLTAEKLFLAANATHLGTKYSVCRYGNVAGSTGSVIPTWRARIYADEAITMTDPDCTRFFMTLTEAVRLVLNTITSMHGGELNIPQLPAYRLKDLATAMGVTKAQDIHLIPLGHGEKMHESMVPGATSAQARRMSIDELREALGHV